VIRLASKAELLVPFQYSNQKHYKTKTIGNALAVVPSEKI